MQSRKHLPHEETVETQFDIKRTKLNLKAREILNFSDTTSGWWPIDFY